MRHSRRLLFVSVLLLCVGCDHAAKLAARAWLAPDAVLSLAASTIRFELAYNPGAFLSLGAELPAGLRAVALLGIVPLGLLVATALVLRSGPIHRHVAVAIGLLIGGGLANALDRLAHHGTVTDFVSLGIGPLRTGIFNVADAAIVAGVLLLVAGLRRGGAQPPRSEA